MIGHMISPRYARVLFDLDCGNLDQRLEDLDAIISILHDNPKLVKFLKSPQIALKDKKKLLLDALKPLDQKFISFLSYLIQKGRLIYLIGIAHEYRLLVNAFMKRSEADLVTAVPIDGDSERKLVEKLEKVFHKKLKLNKKIDPKIIGGAILITSNQMLDWSVAGRLKKLRTYLKSSIG